MSDQDGKQSELNRPGVVDRLRSLFGGGSISVRHDIEEALADSSTGEISAQELSMLRSVLSLHDLRIRDIMVPRADIISIELKDNLAEVLNTFRKAGHSRLPVHGQTLDDPRGMVHIRDFLDYLASRAGLDLGEQATKKVDQENDEKSKRQELDFGKVSLDILLEAANIVRPVIFVPPSMLVLDLLYKMQAERTHMALIIDEYGGTDGLVSIEDVIEVIVGDIEDEHDEEDAPLIAKAAGGSLIVDARATIDATAAELDVKISELFQIDDDIDTIGGLVATIAGRVPIRGEVIKSDFGMEFEILDADPRRVKKIRIRKKPIRDSEQNPAI